MTLPNITNARAFAVRFKELERWSVGSFFETDWRWHPNDIKALSLALKRKSVEVQKGAQTPADLCLVTLHFDGEMEPRGEKKNTAFKGRLFYADPGDVIYSKIDVRNGAIGIVPDELGRICVSSEFPVYSVDPKIADPRYIKLLFRTEIFRKKINSMISGTSGRKRVQPSDLEAVSVPLPGIPEQQKIVREWEKTESLISQTLSRVHQLEKEIEFLFLSDLGLKYPEPIDHSSRFSIIRWSETSRWDLPFFQAMAFDPVSKKYPTVDLRKVVLPISKTMKRITPSQHPLEDFNYLGMENVEARSGSIVNFVVRKGSTIKSACVLFDKEHVLYGKLRPYLRKVVDCSALPFDTGVASSEFLALKPNTLANQNWLAYLLRSIVIAEQAKKAIGARMPRISPRALLGFRIPLPSPAQQAAIMERLEDRLEEIAGLKSDATKTAKESRSAIDAMILGSRKVS